MSATVFALFGLCMVFCAYGVPVDITISPPEPSSHITKPEHDGNKAQTQGGGVEGDMKFPPGVDPKGRTRGVAKFGNIKWPNGVIPYDISAISNAADRQTITNAMNELMYAVATPIEGSNDRSACVYFRPRQSTDQVYFKIQYGNGCSAHVGYMTYHQSVMTLQQRGCFYSGTIQHELMHVLGFFHEQSRPDRDSHLEIRLQNVEPNMRHNFDKYAWGSSAYNQGAPYDYDSIMHYDTTAFSMNGQPTMLPRKSGARIGHAEDLSPIDIAEVRHLYGCDA